MLLLFLFLFVNEASAENGVFYLDPNGTTGNCTQSNPCADLNLVAAATQANFSYYDNIDVFFAAGRYVLACEGTMGLQFYQNRLGKISFYGNESELDCEGKDPTMTFHASQISIDRLTVSHNTGVIFAATPAYGVASFQLTNCVFNDVGGIALIMGGKNVEAVTENITVHGLTSVPTFWLSNSTPVDSCQWSIHNVNFFNSSTDVIPDKTAITAPPSCNVTLEHVSFLGGSVNPISMSSVGSRMEWNDVNFNDITIGSLAVNYAAMNAGSHSIRGSTFSGIKCVSTQICDSIYIFQLGVGADSVFLMENCVFENNNLGLIQTLFYPVFDKCGTVQLINNTFHNNHPKNQTPVSLLDITPLLSMNKWINNSVVSCSSCVGGALQIAYDAYFTESYAFAANVIGDIFMNNTVPARGGHISVSTPRASAPFTFTNVSFVGGRARQGGAVDINAAGQYKFLDCVFKDNEATDKYNNFACSNGNVFLTNTTIDSSALQCDAGCSIQNNHGSLCPTTGGSTCGTLCWGLIGGGAALLLIIVAVILCWYRKRRSEEAYTPLNRR